MFAGSLKSELQVCVCVWVGGGMEGVHVCVYFPELWASGSSGSVPRDSIDVREFTSSHSCPPAPAHP